MKRPRFLSRNDSNGLVGLTLGAAQRCPYCHDALGVHEPLLVCPACRTIAHRACLGEGGHCVTYGCPSREGAEAPRPSPWRSAKGRGSALALGVALIATGLVGAWLSQPSDPPLAPGPVRIVRVPVEVPVVVERPPLERVVYVERAQPKPRRIVLDRGRQVTIKGTLEGAAPLRVTVDAPGGQGISWEADEAGPFMTTFTLPPDVRPHQVSVRVTDCWGATRQARYTVE